jgi:RimJ/RimL family protein N-acetyltransferase
MVIDTRICKRIERISGLPFQMFPDEGVHVRVSDARTDKPKNRLLVVQVAGKNGVLVTGIPRILDSITDCVQYMNNWELFSPFGIAEIKRSLPRDDAVFVDESYGLNYVLTEHKSFRPAKSRYKVTPLKKRDIPSEQYDLRMMERRSSEKVDFIWAFACYHEDPGVAATRLGLFGPRCASIAIIIWEDDSIASFGVGTEESLEGQGYARAAVSAATQWILEQDAIAWYGAFSNNVPSLRIARRLGFSLAYRSFGA